MGTGTGLWHLVCIDDISLNENLETQVKAIKPIMVIIIAHQYSNLLNYSSQKFSMIASIRGAMVTITVSNDDYTMWPDINQSRQQSCTELL